MNTGFTSTLSLWGEAARCSPCRRRRLISSWSRRRDLATVSSIFATNGVDDLRGIMTYTRMDRMTAEDCAYESPLAAPPTLDLVLGQLELLKDEDHGTAAVNRYTHSLQTASRAL